MAVKLRPPLLLLVVLLLFASGLGAQQITGTIRDQSTGQPMAAVQISLPGTGIGALSQQNGRYLLLNVPTGTHTIVVERIGYKKVERQITVAQGAQTIQQDFSLAEEALGLDEIVVTGTAGGTQRSPGGVRRRRGLRGATLPAHACAVETGSWPTRQHPTVLEPSPPPSSSSTTSRRSAAR